MLTEAKLPPFNENGDLPPGIHLASFAEITNRFGVGDVFDTWQTKRDGEKRGIVEVLR